MLAANTQTNLFASYTQPIDVDEHGSEWRAAGMGMWDKYGRPGQNDTRDKMKQRDFSNNDAIYDVSYSNWMRILKFAIL